MIAEKPQPQTFSSLWTNIRVRLTRYLSLLRKRWWLLVLTVSLGLCGAGWYLSQQPPAYLSTARMMVSGQIRLNEGAQYTEELFNFFGTQVELMKSGEVRERAHARVAALHPDLPAEDVVLDVGQVPKASIFIMRGIGKSALYTQAYVDACMDEYIAAKKEMRSQKSESTTEAIADELMELEKEMQKADEEMHEFQKKNNIGFLHEEGNSAAIYVARVNRELADLRSEYNLLAKLDLDQNLDRQRQPAYSTDSSGKQDAGAPAGLSLFSPMEAYQKAKQQVEELNAERRDLSKRLRPEHPTIVALDDQISKATALLESSRQQSVESLKSRRDGVQLQIENLEAVAKEWGEKALDLSGRIAEFDKITSKSQRAKAEYERLLSSRQSVDVTKHVNQDTISILERASTAISTRPGLQIILAAGVAAGALFGCVILFILDKLDDRIGSFVEFRMHFGENLLGQIPRESTLSGTSALLLSNDSRHSLLESFRTLRSSILFLPVAGARPKTLLVTSATPGEGKTTVASNLAISLAFSGAKTLLIDADLRRGKLHEIFDIGESQGFSKVLQQRVSWAEAIVPTSTPNLSLLPRGKPLEHPGEHFLGKVTDRVLQEIYKQFEYIVIDSAPVMAADDTLSFAPKIDGTIFVVRFATSSARASRKSIELLNQRQINVLGIVCNDVKLSESEYGYGYYYQYSSDTQEPAAKIKAGA